MSEIPTPSLPEKRSNQVAIAAIVAVTVIILSCIFACGVVAVAFLRWAPWG